MKLTTEEKLKIEIKNLKVGVIIKTCTPEGLIEPSEVYGTVIEVLGSGVFRVNFDITSEAIIYHHEIIEVISEETSPEYYL